jgi:hypothetical protein
MHAWLVPVISAGITLALIAKGSIEGAVAMAATLERERERERVYSSALQRATSTPGADIGYGGDISPSMSSACCYSQADSSSILI